MIFQSVAQAAETAAAHAHSVGLFEEAETWVAITWLIVVGLLGGKVYRALVGKLDKRQEEIRTRIADAERLHIEAQETLASYQKKQLEAAKEAEDIVRNAKAEAERLSNEAALELEEMMRRREQQAIDRIKQAEAEALREVRDSAVDIALLATSKLLVAGLSGDQATRIVDKAIEELPQRLN